MAFETEIPSQQQERGTPYYGRRSADILQIGRIARARIVPENDKDQPYRLVTRPGAIEIVDYGTSIKAANTGQIAITRNEKRKRFVIINPDTAAGTLYFSFGPTQFSWVPLVPGAIWDESGSEIFIGDLFVKSATAGAGFGALEGIPVAMQKDELKKT